MSCEICGRSSCTRSFHSLDAQEEYDAQSNAVAQDAATEHQWVGANSVVKWPHCRVCGVIKRRDGGNSVTCKGTPKITVRDAAPEQGTPRTEWGDASTPRMNATLQRFFYAPEWKFSMELFEEGQRIERENADLRRRLEDTTHDLQILSNAARLLGPDGYDPVSCCEAAAAKLYAINSIATKNFADAVEAQERAERAESERDALREECAIYQDHLDAEGLKLAHARIDREIGLRIDAARRKP